MRQLHTLADLKAELPSRVARRVSLRLVWLAVTGRPTWYHWPSDTPLGLWCDVTTEVDLLTIRGFGRKSLAAVQSTLLACGWPKLAVRR